MGTKCLSLAIIPTTASMILNEIIITNVVVSRKIAMYQDTEIFYIPVTLYAREKSLS